MQISTKQLYHHHSWVPIMLISSSILLFLHFTRVAQLVASVQLSVHPLSEKNLNKLVVLFLSLSHPWSDWMSLLNRRFEQQVERVAALIPSTVCLGWPCLGYLLPMTPWRVKDSELVERVVKGKTKKKKKTLTSIFVTLAMFNMSIWILFILFRSFCFICYFVFAHWLILVSAELNISV